MILATWNSPLCASENPPVAFYCAFSLIDSSVKWNPLLEEMKSV